MLDPVECNENDPSSWCEVDPVGTRLEGESSHIRELNSADLRDTNHELQVLLGSVGSALKPYNLFTVCRVKRNKSDDETALGNIAILMDRMIDDNALKKKFQMALEKEVLRLQEKFVHEIEEVMLQRGCEVAKLEEKILILETEKAEMQLEQLCTKSVVKDCVLEKSTTVYPMLSSLQDSCQDFKSVGEVNHDELRRGCPYQLMLSCPGLTGHYSVVGVLSDQYESKAFNENYLSGDKIGQLTRISPSPLEVQMKELNSQQNYVEHYPADNLQSRFVDDESALTEKYVTVREAEKLELEKRLSLIMEKETQLLASRVEIERLKGEVFRMQELLTKLTSENRLLKSEINTVLQEKAFLHESITPEVSQSQAGFESLGEEKSSLVKQVQQLSVTKSQVHSLEQDNTRLRQLVLESRKECEALSQIKKQSHALEEDINMLRAERLEWKQSMESGALAIASLEGDVYSLLKKAASLETLFQKKSSAQSKRLLQQTRRLQFFDKSCHQLRCMLNELKEERLDLQAHIQQLQSNLQRLCLDRSLERRDHLNKKLCSDTLVLDLYLENSALAFELADSDRSRIESDVATVRSVELRAALQRLISRLCDMS